MSRLFTVIIVLMNSLIALRIAGVGRVTVSLLRSTHSPLMPGSALELAAHPTQFSGNGHQPTPDEHPNEDIGNEHVPIGPESAGGGTLHLRGKCGGYDKESKENHEGSAHCIQFPMGVGVVTGL